jgi:hypothetical protein
MKPAMAVVLGLGMLVGGQQISAAEPVPADAHNQKMLANDRMMKDCVAKQGVEGKIPMSKEQMVIACNRSSQAKQGKVMKEPAAKSPSGST